MAGIAKKDWQAILKGINRSHRLDVVNQRLDDSHAKDLSDSLKNNRSLFAVNLRTNQITHNGIKHLCASIENNTAINELILANNIIGDKGARHLWALLKVNNTLTSLDISRNQITENCIDELKNALKENYSLTDLSLSLEDFNDNPATGDIKSYLKRNQLLRHNLFNAIIEEKSDEMLRLINQGVSLVCTSSLHKKRTPLHLAVHLRNIKMIKLLVEIMRSRGIPLIHRDLDDKTALDLAQNDPEILQLLTASAPGHSFKISNMNPAPPPKKSMNPHIIHGNTPNANTMIIRNSFSCHQQYDSRKKLRTALPNINSFTYLDLGSDELGDEGAKQLSLALMQGNHKLTELKIYNNAISDNGIEYLCTAFATSSSLEKINICGNQITDKGANIILNMLQNNFIIIEIDIAFNKIQDKEIITSIKNCLDRNRFTHNKSAKLTCHKEASNNNNQIPSTERKERKSITPTSTHRMKKAFDVASPANQAETENSNFSKIPPLKETETHYSSFAGMQPPEKLKEKRNEKKPIEDDDSNEEDDSHQKKM